MGIAHAPGADRIHRRLVAIVASGTLAMLMIQHGAARRAQRASAERELSR